MVLIVIRDGFIMERFIKNVIYWIEIDNCLCVCGNWVFIFWFLFVLLI